jgi:iron complex transport system substrate-binding protein
MKGPSSLRRIILTGIFLLIAIATLGAQAVRETRPAIQSEGQGQGIVYTDSIGMTIDLPYIPRRIVSMGPNVTETIFALGAEKLLVGRTDYCDYPQEAAAIESVGTLWQPSIEKILALEPDLIIASSLANNEVLQALRKTGIPLATIDKQSSVAGTMEMIKDIGLLCGREDESLALVAALNNRIETVVKKVEGLPRPTCYYVIDFGQFDSTATGDTYIDEMISLAGGNNVAKDGHYWTYSKELLAEKDPQIIILSAHWGSDFESTKQLFCSSSVYRDLSAVKTDSIYPIDNDAVDRQGPRTAQAIEDFARIFPPQAMAE